MKFKIQVWPLYYSIYIYLPKEKVVDKSNDDLQYILPSFSNDNGNVYQACSDASQTEETLLDNETYKQNEYELNDSISLVNDRIEKSFNLDNKNDPRFVLNELRTKNLDRPIIACININFLENKFEPLKSITKENIDILLYLKQNLMIRFH